jgi:pimeloyl-ACP methyl ester carboxylesterase
LAQPTTRYPRVILFDRRGCGISDREGTAVTPTLEERMDDVIAVLDAVGSESIVQDSHAPAAWILADRAGNRVYIAAWPDGARE